MDWVDWVDRVVRQMQMQSAAAAGLESWMIRWNGVREVGRQMHQLRCNMAGNFLLLKVVFRDWDGEDGYG